MNTVEEHQPLGKARVAFHNGATVVSGEEQLNKTLERVLSC